MIEVAAGLLDSAIAEGLGSAAALGVATPDGRWFHTTGTTVRWRRNLDGALEPRLGQPVMTATPFDLASLTKPLCTLTILAQLLRDGRVHLHDRLDTHLLEARGTALGDATLAELCSHASGAPAWLDYWQLTREQPQPAQHVRRAVLQTPRGPAGVQAIYSDLGYLALGWLLEAVLGTDLDTAFAERVAAPLASGLHFRRLSLPTEATHIVATEIWPPRCPDGEPLQGAVHDDNAAALDGVAGHAGLFGSVDDVLTAAQAWLEAHLDTRGPLGLEPQVVRELVTTPAVPDATWRHGWDTPTLPGSTAGDRVPHDAFGHLGFTGTSVWLAPSCQAVVVLLTNRVHPDRTQGKEALRGLRRAVHDALWTQLTPPR